MAIGKVGSFATDAPLQKNYIGEALTQVGEMALHNRQEKRLEDKAKKDEEDAKLKEYTLYDSKLKSDYTNVNNIDSKINDYLYSQKEDSAKANQVLNNPNSTREQKIQAMSLKNGTLNNIDQLDQAVKFFNANNKNLEEGVRAGKYDQSSLDNMQKVLGAVGEGDVRFGNKNGVLTISAYERDAEGKLIKVIADNEPLGDFVRNHLTPDLKSNLEEQISKYHTEYQASSTKNTDASGTTIFHKGIDSTKGSKDWNNATEKAVGILSNEPELKRASKKYKLPITDVEGIASKLRDDLLNGVPTQDENIKDASLIFQKYKFGQEKKEDEAVVGVVETPPIYTESGIVPMTGYKTISVSGGKPIQQIVGVNTKTGNKNKMDNAFLNSYTVFENSNTKERHIAAAVTYVDYKSAGYTANEMAMLMPQVGKARTKEEADLILSKATKPISFNTRVVRLTEADAFKYLPVVGAKSVNQMKDMAKPQYTNVTETQKGTIGVRDGKWYDVKTGKEIK